MILTSAAFANGPSPDVVLLESLLEKSHSLPQNKKEALKALAIDLSLGDRSRVESLLYEASFSTHDIIVKGLLGGEDAENTVQLLGLLETNDESFFKFLSAVRKQVHSNPAKLERVRNNLEIVYADLLATPVRTPALGVRWLQSVFLSLGIMSITYSTYPSLVHAFNTGNQHAFLPYIAALVGFTALSSVNEFRVMRRSWKSYRIALKERWRTEKNLKYYSRLLRGMKEAPDLIPAIDRMKFFASKGAEQATLEALHSYPDEFAKTIESLKFESGLWTRYKVFFKTRRFNRTIKRYYKKLNAHDKEQLRKLFLTKGSMAKFLFDLKVKQLDFEENVLKEFEAWMKQEGQKTFVEKYRRVLARRAQELNYLNDSAMPRNAYGLMTTTLGLSLGILGLQHGLENFNHYGYNTFFDQFEIFMQTNREYLLKGLVVTVVTPMTFMIYTERKLRKSIQRLKFDAKFDLKELNFLSREYSRLSRRPKTDMSSLSCTGFL